MILKAKMIPVATCNGLEQRLQISLITPEYSMTARLDAKQMEKLIDVIGSDDEIEIDL